MSGLDVDTRTDIYSLGVLLYELLTGTTPFDKERLRTVVVDEIRRIIREDDPPRPSTRISTAGQAVATVSANRGSEPRKLSALVRGELDWIVMKALEKDRNRRYETVAAFAADVQRYLSDEPVLACPPSAWYRFRKLARRQRRALIPVSAVALAAIVGVTALAVSTAMVWRANQDLKEALDREKNDAYFHHVTLAHGELSRDNLSRAQTHLDQCPAELRRWEWHYLARPCKVEPLVLKHQAEVNSVAISRDGILIAAAGEDGIIKVFDSRTGEKAQTILAYTGPAFSVTFHPEGRYLASTGLDDKVGKAKVWELATGDKIFECPSGADHNRGTAYGVTFNPAGQRLAVGSDGAVIVWDWEATKQSVLPPLQGHPKKGISVAFSPDGQRLATGGWTGELKIWDARTGDLLLPVFGHHHTISAMAFSPDGRRLVSACFDRTLMVWDATTGQRLHILEGHGGLVLGVAFSPDGSRIASTGEDKTVRFWDAASGHEILDLRVHTQATQGVVFSRDGLRLVSGSWDKTIRVWDATPLRGDEAQEALTLSHGANEVWTLAVSPDGRKIAAAGLGANEMPVKIWDVESGREDFELAGHQGVVFCVAWHPDGELITSSGGTGKQKPFAVKVWNVQKREVLFEVPVGPLETPAVAFSSDRKYLVTGGADGAVR